MRSESNDSETGTLLSLNQQLDPRVAGRKAAVLAKLKELGFPVPDGWVIPPDQVGHLLPEPLPASIVSEIDELPRIPLAVRSSAVAEDGDDASFAGMYESILNVSGTQDILQAVRMVANSSHSNHLRSYASERGIGVDSNSPVAILLQHMVPADLAGVAFSANPVTGDREEVVINAVRGLGDQLLAGSADGETWTVRGSRAHINLHSAPVMSPEQAVRVAALAREVEQVQGTPQDIEWAIADDDLYLLQARPITALPVEPEFAPVPPGMWRKETDHFTGLMSVVQGSIYIPEFKRATEAMFSDIGALVERLQLIDRAGELYIQAVPLGERFGPPPPGWVLGLLARVIPQLRARVRQSKEAFDRGMYEPKFRQWEANWKPELTTRGGELVRQPLDNLSEEGLLDHLMQARQLMGDGIQIHFQLSIPTSLAVYDLVMLCRELFGWNEIESLMLIARTAQASSDPSRALEQLIVEASRRERVAGALSDPDCTLSTLKELDPEYFALIQQYLDQFGHRIIDNEISKPTLYERGELLLAMIREGLTSRNSDSQEGDLQSVQRDRAENLLRMRSAADRQHVAQTLDLASRMNALREEKVLYTMYLPGSIMRYALLEIGRRLIGSGTITRQDDIFYCFFEEVVQTLRGEWQASELQPLIASRRAERAWVAAHPGPLTLGPELPMPDPSWLPEPARYLARATGWLFGGSTRQLESPAGSTLQGTGASAGRYRGPVRIIKTQDDFHRLKPGDVLVCSVTTSAWSFLFPVAGALVTDHGGLLSHPAIAAREHGLPAVVGTGDATRRLSEGQIVVVDGSSGTIEVNADR